MPQAKRYYLWNIGCQMNRADADRLADALHERGYSATRDPRRAALLILNTCVVRQGAEDKAVGRLESLKSALGPESGRRLLLMGCLVDPSVNMAQRFPFVDAFFAPSDVAGVLSYVDDCAEETDNTVAAPAASVTEFVPISYGCDHRCTYCIVTLRRGPQQSRPCARVVADARALIDRGARDITLLGQNVDAYGTDLPGRPTLGDVLTQVHDISGLRRLRFLTSHPRDMSEEIIDAASHLPKVCPCWELPVQSGDDDILRRMGRGYSVSRYRELVAHIREVAPSTCAVNTDVIVGFPGETEAQFMNTLELVQTMRFDAVHVAAYSPRPGTVAATWADDVPPGEKERRRQAVEDAQTTISTEIHREYVGKCVEILVDGRQRGRWRGRTGTNTLVFFEAPGDWLGEMVTVQVTWAGAWSLRGEVWRGTPKAGS